MFCHRTMRTIAFLSFVLIAPMTAEAQQDAVVFAQRFSDQLSTQEWLGPMAAIAISPFFGLACLSGIATYGPDWLQQNSAFLSHDSPLNNPTLFWTMTVLTVITSLPRFAKISKPLSLLAENLESYSAVIILVVFRIAATTTSSSLESVSSIDIPMHAGIFSMSNDVMMSLAAAVNLIVINTVKLGIEFLTWLIPIPFVDSLLEIVNKSCCAGLAVLYAFSPSLALVVNLILFCICAFLFLRVTRYLRFIKTIYVWPTVRAAMGIDESKEVAFPAFTINNWKGIPSRSELWLERTNDDRIRVRYSTWLSTHDLGMATIKVASPGLLTDSYVLHLDEEDLQVQLRRGTVARSSMGAIAADG